MSWRHFVFKIYSWQPQGRERFFFFSYVWCPLRQRVCESLLSLLKALKDTTRRQRPLGLFRICVDFPSFPVPCLILFSSLGLWCPSHIGFRLCFVDVEKGLHICYLSPPATSSSVKEVQELLYWENVTKGSKGSWEVFLMSSPIFLHLLSYTHTYIYVYDKCFCLSRFSVCQEFKFVLQLRDKQNSGASSWWQVITVQLVNNLPENEIVAHNVLCVLSFLILQSYFYYWKSFQAPPRVGMPFLRAYSAYIKVVVQGIAFMCAEPV